ncbi:MAG: response regulator [Pseudomonadota bacterium]|nr:response regulator [Pseudomonadota bacterium]
MDDQQTMRGLARQCLKRLGVVDVTLAAAGDQALEAMMTKKFDVVISDLNMPGLTGVELAKKIKEHPVFKATPVFLATSDAYRDQAAVDTVDHFVAKPFSVADMRTAIEAHLGALT